MVIKCINVDKRHVDFISRQGRFFKLSKFVRAKLDEYEQEREGSKLNLEGGQNERVI